MAETRVIKMVDQLVVVLVDLIAAAMFDKSVVDEGVDYSVCNLVGWMVDWLIGLSGFPSDIESVVKLVYDSVQTMAVEVVGVKIVNPFVLKMIDLSVVMMVVSLVIELAGQ